MAFLKQLLPIEADEHERLFHTHTAERPNVQLHMSSIDIGLDGDLQNDAVRFVVNVQTGPRVADLEPVFMYNNYSEDIEGEEYIDMEDEFNHTVLVRLVMRRVNEKLQEFRPQNEDDVDFSRWKEYHNETANHIQDDWERDPSDPFRFIKTGDEHSAATYR